jgi:hypothetical protein
MGIDSLDILFRLEKSFNVKIARGDTERLLAQAVTPGKTGVRCGDIHVMVLKLCAEQGLPVPSSSWTRVKLCIMHGCRAKAKKVRRDAWLVDDVGCC